MQWGAVRSNVALGTCVYQFLQQVGGSKQRELQECLVVNLVKEELNQQNICMEIEHVSRSGAQRTCYCELGLSTSTSTYVSTCGFIRGKTCINGSPVRRYPALKIPMSTGDDLEIMQLPITTRHFSTSDLIIRN